MHLHLADAHAAARAPGHGVIAAIDQAALVTFPQKTPDGVVVLVRHREVAAPLVGRLLPIFIPIPVHPVTEADGLVCLLACKLVDARLARLHKLVDAGEAIAW